MGNDRVTSSTLDLGNLGSVQNFIDGVSAATRTTTMETVDRRREEEEKRSADPSRHVRTTRSECVALRLAALAFQRSAAKGAQNLVNAVLADDVVHDVLDDVIVVADAVDLRDEGEAVVRRLRERIAACSDLATRVGSTVRPILTRRGIVRGPRPRRRWV